MNKVFVDTWAWYALTDTANAATHRGPAGRTGACCAAHESAAWEIFEKHADQKFSYTDCTSFAVMQALGLTHAFTADHHFATMGFILAP